MGKLYFSQSFSNKQLFYTIPVPSCLIVKNKYCENLLSLKAA